MPKMITGISIDAGVVKKAKAKAKAMRRTFSNYVEGLLIADQDKVINIQAHQRKTMKLKRRK